MTAPVQETQLAQEARPNDKEFNFRAQEAKYQRMLDERDRRIAELEQKKVAVQDDYDDEDDSADPYVDRKKLKKELNKYGQKVKQDADSAVKTAVQQAIYEERQRSWLKSNPDFTQVLEHAQKLYDVDPELGDTILEMPEGFERQKLVYKSIKALGLHKPAAPKESIQTKIDANRRGAYYQPSGMGAAPYAAQGDFSQGGQKNAYEKMMELKRNLRLG